MTEMQKQFEEWAISVGKYVSTDEDGEYNNHIVGYCWQAWQASRASVIVKTDTMKDPSYEETGMVYLDVVEQALGEEGIRYE